MEVRQSPKHLFHCVFMGKDNKKGSGLERWAGDCKVNGLSPSKSQEDVCSEIVPFVLLP